MLSPQDRRENNFRIDRLVNDKKSTGGQPSDARHRRIPDHMDFFFLFLTRFIRFDERFVSQTVPGTAEDLLLDVCCGYPYTGHRWRFSGDAIRRVYKKTSSQKSTPRVYSVVRRAHTACIQSDFIICIVLLALFHVKRARKFEIGREYV